MHNMCCTNIFSNINGKVLPPPCTCHYWPRENKVYYMWLAACLFSSSFSFTVPFSYFPCISCIQCTYVQIVHAVLPTTILFHYIFTSCYTHIYTYIAMLVYIQLVRTRNMYPACLNFILYFYRNLHHPNLV